MPTEQFALVKSNTCCAYALMAIEYCSTNCPLSVAEFSEAMYGNQPITMQLTLTFCQGQSHNCQISTIFQCPVYRRFFASWKSLKVYILK